MAIRSPYQVLLHLLIHVLIHPHFGSHANIMQFL